MTALISEIRVSLTKLAQENDVAVSTVWRWANRGVRGAKLETFLIGGKRFTTREAFDRFVTATNQCDTIVTAASRESAIVKAERELDSMGL